MRLIGNENRRKLYIPKHLQFGLGYSINGKVVREICDKSFLVGYLVEEWYDESNEKSKITVLYSADKIAPLVYTVNDYALTVSNLIAPYYKDIPEVKKLIGDIPDTKKLMDTIY
ncbi:MAG: hypothetical protein ACXAEU_14450 [Candidatus Hodarchaeales archaeon]|jgi:hypothetical protein